MSENYKFTAKDFYALLEKQKYTCPLTNRELTPESTRAELIIPKERGGQNAFENIYLVDRDVAKVKRSMLETEIFALALDIVKSMGRKRGYTLRKIAK
ncbi:HNH endonuclease [Turneriella parva]|uniref:HNH endonuclease n=1 Tax=Turneriella parva (strain ATCC BAA-1111 / DSM 21527 / NCTC 11395 / H) TaxID=869212 RepID=I4B7P4_TURPD|nr:hypothetical protein [Turneriella parva]AFM13301.1 hypothetical protein Turpa_2661 [Turneriella parva DSM 21527]